jgi:hypothetical protein
MQLQLDREEKLFLMILMEDFAEAARRRKDREERRYFERMSDKFTLNTVICNVNPYELRSITTAVSGVIAYANEAYEKKKPEGDDLVLADENIRIMSGLHVKLSNYVQAIRD